jgi:hypothetical protein
MSERNIRTIFYGDKEARVVTKKIASGNAIRATGTAVMHMRRNTYKAMLAEVYGEHNGKLYSVIIRELDGSTHILYQSKLTPAEKAGLE